MGSSPDPFINLVEAAKLLGRTPEMVNSLCDDGLIRRRSTGREIMVHAKDVQDVADTNMHSIARPKELVRKVLILERQVASLQRTVDLMGKVNGFLSSSLDCFDETNLLQLSEKVSQFLDKDEFSVGELLQFSEIFLRVSDSDIVRLNKVLGNDDNWQDFYKLALKMTVFSRECKLPMSRDLETAQVLLSRGLRNVRSIGVLFVENASLLKSSRELLEECLGHDLVGFDLLIKKLKNSEGSSPFTQNF